MIGGNNGASMWRPVFSDFHGLEGFLSFVLFSCAMCVDVLIVLFPHSGQVHDHARVDVLIISRKWVSVPYMPDTCVLAPWTLVSCVVAVDGVSIFQQPYLSLCACLRVVLTAISYVLTIGLSLALPYAVGCLAPFHV